MTTTDLTPIDLAPAPVLSAIPAAPAMPSLQHEDADAAADREDSFSDVEMWNGQPLQPFSVERYSIFVSQRTAMGSPRLGAALVDGNAFYPDALRILFLCSQPERALQILRRDPGEMQQAIEAWATDHAPVHRSAAVVAAGISIFNSAHENRHEPRHAGSPAAGSSSGN